MIADRFEIVELLAPGAIADTYLCTDRREPDPAVVKVATDAAADPLVRREAHALGRLEHPRVAGLRAEGEHEARAWLAMDFVPGPTLESWRHGRGGALAPVLVSRVIGEIAEGLDALHDAGVIHGDVKGENVIVHPESGARLIDVGLSSQIRPGVSQRAMGTPSHVPPERVAGGFVPAHQLPRQDVYSLAVVAFELLTSELPFEAGDVMDLLRAQVHEAPRRPSDLMSGIDADLDDLLRRALSKDPAERPPTPGALADALTAALEPFTEEIRVLVADDDDDWRRLLTHALARRLPGVLVHGASDGAAALAVARRYQPTAAVLDLDMPEADGLEVALELRRRYGPGMPIVAVTGVPSSRRAERLRSVAHALLTKPARPRRIARQLGRFLSLPQAA